MEGVLEKFQELKIKLDEITHATNKFNDENLIGVGGYGSVYKGELSHFKGRSMVAIKRLVGKLQGEAEFLKEIDTLTRYKHENLITLLGFCYQGDEAILVYELASRGSLDKHLNSHYLKWSQRIKICLDAAKGLSYLHDPRGTHQRLIHCDVKCGNILLDNDWNAKVADFGFSIIGPANEQQSTIITLAAGTKGYIDPLYWKTNTLTKESDVYSFGVVLFEVLCGGVWYTLDSKGEVQSLVPTWKERYEQKKINDTIFRNPIQPLEQSALEIFSDIAYRCLEESRDDRPDMAEVVIELESALESQELFESLELLENQEFKGEWNKQHSYYENIIKPHRSEVELMKIMSKGVLNRGKTYFALNKKGKHCEMISIAECLGSTTRKLVQRKPEYNSRFAVGTYRSGDGIFKTRVKTQFLSPGITYTVNLVFKYAYPDKERRCEPIYLKYKLQGGTESSISHLAYEREDGWWMCELYQLTSDHTIVYLQILFEGFQRHHTIEVEGIEFRPLEKVEHKDENHTIPDTDANWEKELPADYEDIMKLSRIKLQWTTKKEAYSIMCKGFLIRYGDKGSIWFSLDKNGKKCHMLSTAIFQLWDMRRLSLPESRFGEAFEHDFNRTHIDIHIHSQLVSPETTYGMYLVYNLREDHFGFEVPLNFKESNSSQVWYVYLARPQTTPVIRPKADHNTHNTPNKLEIIKGLPQQRNDGWMEVQIWELQSPTTTKRISMCMERPSFTMLKGLIIEGIELRPI